jgi:hypothetical protein
VAREHLVAEHLSDLLRIARHFGADARLVANRVQATAARRLEKDAAPGSESRAIELLFLVGIGPGEIGGGGDPVVDHALPLVAEDVDAGAAALLLARKGRAVRLVQ